MLVDDELHPLISSYIPHSVMAKIHDEITVFAAGLQGFGGIAAGLERVETSDLQRNGAAWSSLLFVDWL